MNIGFVAHNFIRGNGQGRINYEIVQRALHKGHHVTLLANRVDLELSDAGAKWTRVRPLPHRPNLLGAYTAAFNADRALAKLREPFDVLIGAGFTLRTAHDVSLCQFVHGAWLRSPVHVSKLRGGIYGLYQKTYTAANARWERDAYAAARCVVAPSEKIKTELLSIGVPADRVRVIYNGVDPTEFKPATDSSAKQKERAELNLPATAPLALFVGDIRTPRKNLDSVLKAIVSLPHVHLSVVGELAMSPFPAMAKQLGIADRVHFAGYSLDVKRYMQAADFFVFPSRYEAGTLVLMEAAASGLPIVTAKTAGGAEIFGTDAAVTIEDPDDVSALTRAIARFSDSPQERIAASAAALAIGRQHAWQRMADAYLELFAAQSRVAPKASSALSASVAST